MTTDIPQVFNDQKAEKDKLFGAGQRDPTLTKGKVADERVRLPAPVRADNGGASLRRDEER